MDTTVEAVSPEVPDWARDAVFACERQSASRARSFVSSQLIEHRLLRLVDRVRAVASELATNAIVHARTPFTLTLSRTGPSVLLTVHDDSSRRPTHRLGEVMAEGGRGLNLIAALSRDWGTTTYADDTKSVWASFDIHHVGEHGWS